jgi:2-amino-4-hydroxy-6-hydroxymethyldihydropteridine diphosphokinase
MRHFSEQDLVLGLGSNKQQAMCFRQALDALTSYFGDVFISSVYQSLPVDAQSLKERSVSESIPSRAYNPSYYYNAVVAVKSELPIEEIKKIARDIEQQCGRERLKNVAIDPSDKTDSQVDDAVTMDVDCLLYGERINQSADVFLPHENITTMAYVLRPLAELFPDTVYPQSNKMFSELWNEMAGQYGVSLEPVDFVWRDQVISVAPPCLVL